MHANSILALSGVLGFVAAIPHAGQHHQHHHHHKRELVWETKTEEVIVTVPVTRTVWLEPGETPPTVQKEPSHYHAPQPPKYTPPSSPAAPAYSAPVQSSPVAPAPPAYTPPVESSPAAPAYTPPVESSPAPPAYTPPVESSPAPAYTPPVESSPAPPAYTPPPAPVTPSSSYVAPAPSSAAPAPEPSQPSAGGSGLSYGMGKSGTYYTGDLTYYDVGLGACGISSTPDQAVVAVAQSLFDSYGTANPNLNPLCNKTVSITGSDGTITTATIVDRCTGCADSDLDLSTSLFKTVVPDGNGRVGGMKWCFD